MRKIRVRMPIPGMYGYHFITGLVMFCAAAASAQTPTFSLQAVQVDARITLPTNVVEALPGSIIVAEIFARDWSPNGEELRGFQVAIDTSSFESGDVGSVRPLGSQHVCPPQPCKVSGDCGAGMSCLQDGCCYGPDHLPTAGFFISENRPDYIFFGLASFGVVDALNYRYLRTLAEPIDCPSYPGSPRYTGTLILEVSQDAFGVFTIPLLPFLDSQMLACDPELTRIRPLETESLVIVVGNVVRRLIGSSPPDCSTDARQLTNPAGAVVAARDSIALWFNTPLISDLTVADFQVREVPPAQTPIDVAAVSADDSALGRAIVTLSRPMTKAKWTCITFLSAPPAEVCVSMFPGDVDGNGTVEIADAVTLADHLAGTRQPPLEDHQCDVDQSGQCGPADLLRTIDLFNGSEVYDPWLGRTLPTCPSVP